MKNENKCGKKKEKKEPKSQFWLTNMVIMQDDEPSLATAIGITNDYALVLPSTSMSVNQCL